MNECLILMINEEENEKMCIEVFSDADWAGDKMTRKSVTGGVLKLNGSVVKWMCKTQTMVTTSTMEAEYVAASQVMQTDKDLWMLLKELNLNLNEYMDLSMDNQAAIKQICRRFIVHKSRKERGHQCIQ